MGGYHSIGRELRITCAGTVPGKPPRCAMILRLQDHRAVTVQQLYCAFGCVVDSSAGRERPWASLWPHADKHQ
jgi:hypothetical protein